MEENIMVTHGRHRKLAWLRSSIWGLFHRYGRIAPRSGLSVKYGIHVGAGVIDPDYTGELKVNLFNLGVVPYEIKKGDRIAQLILEKCMTPFVEEVSELTRTMRANRGFGSTGIM